MRVGIATDDGGFEWKEKLAVQRRLAGDKALDFGAPRMTPDDDDSDFVIPLARAVVAGAADRGASVCGSGVGASVRAKEVKGVRAALIERHFFVVVILQGHSITASLLIS